MRLPGWISRHWAAFRAVLVLTVITGVLYPLGILGAAQIPGLRDNANGSIVTVDGKPVGSELIGQDFGGDPRYFHSRPSAAGDGYDPTSTAASNLGPESIEDGADKPSLLTQVCARGAAVAALERVDASRPYCTGDGVGAVLRVYYSDGLRGRVTRAVSVNQPCPATPFIATYRGTAVECARPGAGHGGGVLVAIRGDAPADPVVPPDAVTASGSGLDPHISLEYAALQAPRVARERGLAEAVVAGLIGEHTSGRVLGFLGEPGVNVLTLNLALDRLGG